MKRRMYVRNIADILEGLEEEVVYIDEERAT